jgi:peptide/nickel transport system permease protein
MTLLDPGVGSPLEPADDPGPALPAVRAHRSWLVVLCSGWLALVVLAALLAPVLPLADYGEVAGTPRGGPEFSLDGLLGYDVLGRSMLSRVVSGAQASLLVGVVSALIAFVAGSFLGLLAGFLRGAVDTVISFVTDTLLAFPPLVLLLALASVLRPSISTLIVSLSLLMTPTFTRLARANTMRWASREFVMAAQNMGAGLPRLMGREVLPNVVPSVASYLPVVIAALIVAEGSLSFLGLGIPSPTPSWGGMIADGQDLISRFPNLVFVPAVTILLTVLALNIVGDGLRLRFGERTR